MTREDSLHLDGACYVPAQKQEKRILCKSILGHHFSVNADGLKECFKSFKNGSNNVPCEEKISFFYKHHVIDPNYTLEDIEKILKEVN